MRALIIILLLFLPADARSHKPVAQFRKAHPCPATGKTTGKCPGFVVDHVIPLCAGGEDSPANLQWQELRASREKDKWEHALCRWMKKQPRCP
jgi:hypothetical protein